LILSSIYASGHATGKAGESKPYLVRASGEDMIPGTIDLKLIDECVSVTDAESFAATRMLAQTEALLVEASCGGSFFGAAQWFAHAEAKGGRPLRVVCCCRQRKPLSLEDFQSGLAPTKRVLKRGLGERPLEAVNFSQVPKNRRSRLMPMWGDTKKRLEPFPIAAPRYVGDPWRQHPDPITGAVTATALCDFTYAQVSPANRSGEFEYSRSHNPTRRMLEDCLALMERHLRSGDFDGMTAISLVLSLLSVGDEVLCCDDVYGGTYRLLTARPARRPQNAVFDLNNPKFCVNPPRPTQRWCDRNSHESFAQAHRHQSCR